MLTGDADTDQVRRNPRVVVIVIALVAAVAAVALATRDGADDESAPTPTEALPEPPFRLLGSAEASRLVVSFLPLASDDPTSDQSQLHTLVAGGVVSRPLAGPPPRSGLLDAGLADPGATRNNMLVTGAGTVVVVGGVIHFYDLDRPSEPAVDLGEGFSLLPGPTPSSVWILGLAERTVRLVELDPVDPDGPEFDLSEVGPPVDSAGNGLVIAPPAGATDQTFAFWTPGDLRPFDRTARLDYLGSGGDRAVFTGSAVGFVSSITEPEQPARVVTLPGDEIHRAAVSTDGSLLAVSIVADREASWISIVDLDTGQEVNRIESAVEVGFHWSGPDTLVHLRPDGEAAVLAERSVAEGVDRNLVRFTDRSWRYSVSRDR